MKKNIILISCLVSSVFMGSRCCAQKDFVQQILLDKPVFAGPLKLFPSFGSDSDKYYYLPNKLRLAVDDKGLPKFLFFYYVTNEGSGTEEELAAIGRTGGYVHLIVGLRVLPEELDEARSELKRINSKGVIMGPVVYRGGTMALVTRALITNSSASNPDPGQKKVLGLGPAPVMEGDNIAVSFVLDSLDAKIMWESLQTPTPDLSFNLNMTIGGYQSPIGFRIDMDWDKIYKHKIFNVGVATHILKAEIGIAAQELREDQSIKVVQVGEDPGLQKLQEAITNKFLEMCFVPFGGEGSPDWNGLGKPLNDGKSYLDRASESLDKETEAVDKRNRDIRAENLKKENSTEDIARKKAESEARLKKLRAEAAVKDANLLAARLKHQNEKDTTKRARLQDTVNKKEIEADEVRQRILKENQELNDWMAAAGGGRIGAQKDTTKKKELPRPSIAVVASYQQKRIRHSGHYVAEAKSYFTTSLAEPFGDNIGKLNCKSCIRKINTYDPLYVQREIVCFLDGEIANDFDKYINYVSVSMRKQHAGGDITTQEVRVDRRNFNKEGNRFKLLYGWMKGDDDRSKWLDYEYKTTWNFFGGTTIIGEWKSDDNPVIPLSAPIKKYTVYFDSDPEKLKAANIRGITVRVFYTIAGKEQMKQVSMNVSRGVNSVSLDYLLTGNETQFEYEVEWLKGNTNVKSGRIKTSQSIIYVDEIN